MINNGIYKVMIKYVGISMVLMMMTGCYSYSNMTKIPQNSDTINIANNSNKNKLVGYVSSINVKFNNGNTNVNDGFAKKLIQQLQKTNYLQDVMYSVYSKKPDSSYIDISININEAEDLNMGLNMTKSIFTGLSLFILAPALPNSYDFNTDHYLQAAWPDGKKREYKASCAGFASGTFPYVGLLQEYGKIKGDLTDKCLSSIINQFTSEM